MDVRCWLQEEVNAFIRLTLSTRFLSATGLFSNTVSILQLGFFFSFIASHTTPTIRNVYTAPTFTTSRLTLIVRLLLFLLVSLVSLVPLVFCISPIHSISKSQLGSFTPKSVVVQTRSFRIIS
jgi:hypothetical protein